jgi:hypothetical protein
MPLAESEPRKEVHGRQIDMRIYAREDGLFDVEARLVDSKPFAYMRPDHADLHPAQAPLHDLSVRVTLDPLYEVRQIQASMDATPWGICQESADALQSLVGQRIARGWSTQVKERLKGTSGCTHIRELLVTLGTPALQGIRAICRDQMSAEDPERVPANLNTCYAYAQEREVVKMIWPTHHRRTPSS